MKLKLLELAKAAEEQFKYYEEEFWLDLLHELDSRDLELVRGQNKEYDL